MFIDDDITYANNREPLLKVIGVRPLDGYQLWLRFSTHEERVFDASSLFEFPAFEALRDSAVFSSVYLDYGVPTWCDGEIDVAPEFMYENSIEYKRPA